MSEILKYLLLPAAGMTLCVWVLMYLFQDGLLFVPQPLAGSAQQYANLPGVEAVELAVHGGVTLRGYLARPATPPPHPLLIYFGGNAEEVSFMVTSAQRFPGWALLAINYRGYGASEGRPSERALTGDALAIHDHVSKRADIDAARMVALGRSLGSGVAVALAARRPLAAIVLASPYDSMVQVARHHYRLLPVALLLRHRFDSAALAPAIDTPLLMLTAGDDNVIPRERSDALYAAWGGPKSRLDIAGADHNSIDAYPAYWAAIAEFLLRAVPAAAPPG